MKPLTQFIVKPNKDRRYDNIKKIGGLDLIMSSSEEDHTVSNRQGIVVDVPLRYDGPVQVGDTLLVHHNVFKIYNDMMGRRKSGKSFFNEQNFLIDDEQWFMYKHNDQWISREGICFVKPFKDDSGYTQYLTGEMLYSNEYLRSKGVVEGVKVYFEPDSEYEFNIDGVIAYRMFNRNIVGYGEC